MDASTSLPQLLESYTAFDELEALHVKQLQQFLTESKDPYDRSNLLGHIVADAWIVNPKRDHVVLVEHGVAKRWIAPGGHCDGNTDVRDSSIREAQEEAGLTGLIPLLNGNIFDLNVGIIPTAQKKWGLEPPHLHFDICFAFEAPDNAPLTISHESTGLAWVAVKDAEKLNPQSSHYRRPAKTLAGLLG